MIKKYIALIENCFNVAIDLESDEPYVRLYDDGRVTLDGAVLFGAMITANKPVFERSCDYGTYTHIYRCNIQKARGLFKYLGG